MDSISKTIYKMPIGGVATIGPLYTKYFEGPPVNDDIIISGQKAPKKNYMKGYLMSNVSQEYVNQNYAIQKLGHGMFQAEVQLKTPFTYSTSTWTSTGCSKDASEFTTKRSKESSVEVIVDIKTAIGGFLYYPRSLIEPPFITLSMPGENIKLL